MDRFICSLELGFIDTAVFTPTCHGRPKLLHNEFYYTQGSRAENRNGEMSWRCAVQHSFAHVKCKAKALTKVFGKQELVKIIGKHTHEPNYKCNGSPNAKKAKQIFL